VVVLVLETQKNREKGDGSGCAAIPLWRLWGGVEKRAPENLSKIRVS
jgi:hypothetical protein